MATTKTKENGHRTIDIRKSETAPTAPMPATRDPFALMHRLADQFDRQLAACELGPAWLGRRTIKDLFPAFRPTTSELWYPQIEVIEGEGRFIVRADLPGTSKDDISVEIEDEDVVIRGARRSEHEEKEGGYYRSERTYGSFERRVPLPVGVVGDDAKATFRDGVLEISLDASQRLQNRRSVTIES
jgi:HSP20 family protein